MPHGSFWPKRLILLTLLLQPVWAFAYIDPNAGGLLFQLLAPLFAAVVGAWVFMRRTISNSIRAAWQKLRGKKSPD
jgi:hypothetical protein